MSHKMEGKTSLTVENNDCIEEALQEAMPNATILKDEICNGIRERCDYVIRQAGKHDIGLFEWFYFGACKALKGLKNLHTSQKSHDQV